MHTVYRRLMVVSVLVVANVAFVYAGGWRWLEAQRTASVPVAVQADPVLLDVFIFTLEDEVQKKRGGIPEEGYQPHMFLGVFPGLTATDFDGVAASVGHYRFVDGALTLELRDATLVHETPGAISRHGMETLLMNIATRTSIDLVTTGTITDIVRVITAP